MRRPAHRLMWATCLLRTARRGGVAFRTPPRAAPPRRGIIRRFDAPPPPLFFEPIVDSSSNPDEPRVGDVVILNSQRAVPIDEERLRRCIAAILAGARCGEFDVGVELTTDTAIRKLNKQHRRVDAPTDILSFPFHDEAVPGEIPDAVPRDDDDLMNLGDMVVSVEYVARACARDRAAFESNDQEALARKDDDDDKGVARAMATVFDVQQRMHMLMVHGICHLMGYDHETDDDFKSMAALEDDLLAHLAAFEARDAASTEEKKKKKKKGLRTS